LWVHLVYPEIPNDPCIRNWPQQFTIRATAEAMKNDFLLEHPNLGAEEISVKVVIEMFYKLLTRGNTFSLEIIPNIMATRYGQGNTLLVPEHGEYRKRGDALLRHQWNYLASMMPFSLPENYTYDYFRGRFKNDYTLWATFASSPENSILYWINFIIGN
jgi:hypothetical protein